MFKPHKGKEKKEKKKKRSNKEKEKKKVICQTRKGRFLVYTF